MPITAGDIGWTMVSPASTTRTAGSTGMRRDEESVSRQSSASCSLVAGPSTTACASSLLQTCGSAAQTGLASGAWRWAVKPGAHNNLGMIPRTGPASTNASRPVEMPSPTMFAMVASTSPPSSTRTTTTLAATWNSPSWALISRSADSSVPASPSPVSLVSSSEYRNTGVSAGYMAGSARGAVPMMPTTAMSLHTAGRGSLSIRVILMPKVGSDMGK